MAVPNLLTPEAAAELTNLPKASLLRVAEEHGHLIRIGRVVRIPEDELGELINKCRCQRKEPASPSGAARAEIPSGSSRTPVSSSAHAQQIAAKLKSRSPNTSGGRAGRVVPLAQKK